MTLPGCFPNFRVIWHFPLQMSAVAREERARLSESNVCEDVSAVKAWGYFVR